MDARILTIIGLGLAVTRENNQEYFDLSSNTGHGYSTKKREPLKRGKTFKFNDGFECQALNQKNADRKHNNWLKKNNG